MDDRAPGTACGRTARNSRPGDARTTTSGRVREHRSCDGKPVGAPLGHRAPVVRERHQRETQRPRATAQPGLRRRRRPRRGRPRGRLGRARPRRTIRSTVGSPTERAPKSSTAASRPSRSKRFSAIRSAWSHRGSATRGLLGRRTPASHTSRARSRSRSRPAIPPARLDALPGGHVPGHQRQAPVEPELGVCRERQQAPRPRAARSTTAARSAARAAPAGPLAAPVGVDPSIHRTTDHRSRIAERRLTDRHHARARGPAAAGPTNGSQRASLSMVLEPPRLPWHANQQLVTQPERERCPTQRRQAGAAGSGAYAGSWSSTRARTSPMVDRQLVLVQRAGHVRRLTRRAARPRARAGPAPRR